MILSIQSWVLLWLTGIDAQVHPFYTMILKEDEDDMRSNKMMEMECISNFYDLSSKNGRDIKFLVMFN